MIKPNKKTTDHKTVLMKNIQANDFYNAMSLNHPKFKDSHLNWLCDNQKLVKAFVDFADGERLFGIKVSHRFACEFLRWKTEKRELFCEFKLDNDNITMLGHAYNACAGPRSNYFKLKEVDELKPPKGY